MEMKHYNLNVLRHRQTKVRVKGKHIDGEKYVYTRVLEGGTKCSVGIYSCDKKAWWSASKAGGVSVKGA